MDFQYIENEISDSRIIVNFKVFKFDSYRIIRKDGTIYILGENRHYHDLFKYDYSNTYDVFFNLLNLHNRLRISNKINPMHFGKLEINKSISDADLSLVLKFIQKYGFPFYKSPESRDTNPFQNSFANNNHDFVEQNIMYDVPPLVDSALFDVSLFLYDLHQVIYRDFLCVLSRYKNLRDQLELFLTDKDKQLLHSWSSLRSPIDLQSPYYNNFIMRWNNERQSLDIEVANIMHLAAYYLCIMASAGVASGGYIQVCKGCGKLFIADNSRTRYCNAPCTRQNIYMKNKRMKQ